VKFQINSFAGLGEEGEALVKSGYEGKYEKLVTLKTKIRSYKLIPTQPEY
jgi:hypothetical protein